VLVRVAVEEEPVMSLLSREELLNLVRQAQANPPGTPVKRGGTTEEAVTQTRDLRDEWED